MLFKYFLILFTFESISCLDLNSVKVKTSSGLVQGKALTVLNKTINQFLGIPYAEPPVGRLRFAKPEPLKIPLEGILDATEPKNSCMQSSFGFTFGNFNESEDCLVLNIWSQQLSTSFGLKPVMFWIYGGGMTVGSIFQLDLYDGRMLATNDVVIVTANYRLGVFGFLYGGEESAPGNVGLYDQALALKWVKQNIHLFGGNPDLITIFGESAGSYSVSAHILSPISRNLFKRAILQSGAQFSKRPEFETNSKQALNIAKQLSKSFNCSEDNQWLNCLRKLDAKQLNSSPFSPALVIDGTGFLPNSSENAFKTANFRKDIQIMAGVTKDEGSILISLTSNFTLTKTDVINSLKTLLNPGMDQNMISNYYLSKIDTNNETALKIAFSKLVGDLIINCPTHFFVEEFAKYSPNDSVFFYELTHKQSGQPLWGCDQEWKGVCHGSEIPFVFGLPLFKPEVRSDIDKNFSKLVMNLWTDFAKNGKPLTNSSAIKWPTLKASGSTVDSKVIELNPKTFGHILNEPFHSSCDGLWKQYFFEHLV